MPEPDLIDRLTALSLALTDSEWPHASRTCIEAAEAVDRLRSDVRRLATAMELVEIFYASAHRPGSRQRWREVLGPEADVTVMELKRYVRNVLAGTK